ncbi:MAG TPA: hypothetical protein VFL91_08600 [Thermomicrobiales bacterium]|nr:hypothetical protein [Thermomicrobiales bacterium]
MTTGMRCTYDGMLAYRGPLGQPSRCHMQVYEGGSDRLPVVIASELPENEGTSITNAAGQVATQVWRTLLPHAREGIRWIEHYPAQEDAPGRYRREESFDEVTFHLVGPFEVAAPRWTPSGRAAVEALIGHPLHEPTGPVRA